MHISDVLVGFVACAHQVASAEGVEDNCDRLCLALERAREHSLQERDCDAGGHDQADAYHQIDSNREPGEANLKYEEVRVRVELLERAVDLLSENDGGPDHVADGHENDDES